MTRRGGSSDGTFYFQAWHVAKVVSGESWPQNKGLADFVEQNVGPATKKWLYIKGCVPTREKPGLLVPYSICVKLRSPKTGQDPKEAEQALLHFRNEEFPSLAKTYFNSKLRISLDFFNYYSEGADFDAPLANFDSVKTSKRLREKVKSAVKFVKKDFWGDLVHGLVDSSKSEFKAARFIRKRGKGMYKAMGDPEDVEESDIVDICLDLSDPASNPNILPPTPLQNPLPLPVSLPDTSSFARIEQPDVSPSSPTRPRKTSEISDITVGSTDTRATDASSVGSVETAQSSVVAEESSSSELQDAKEASSELAVVAEEEEASTSPAVEEAEVEAAVEVETEVEVEVDAEADAEVDADTEVNAEAEIEAEVEVEADTEVNAEVEVDEVEAEVEAETEVEADAEVDVEAEVETEADAEVEVETEVDAAADAEVDAEAEIEAEVEAEVETDADAEVEAETEVDEVEAEVDVDVVDAEVEVDVTAADSSESSYRETATEPADATSAPATTITPSSGVVATRRKMNYVSPQAAQTAYFMVQNSGNWLRYLMANHGQGAQKLGSTFFDSPIILATPPQALSPDGMTRVYFMSQATKEQDEVVYDQNGRPIQTRKGDKSVKEWVVGTAKISTQALTMHLGKQLENRNARLLPAPPPAVREVDSVVGPNNRLIEMTDAPGIPQAILVTTPPVEDVREGDIVQEEHDDGFVHIETNVLNQLVEEVSDNADNVDKKGKGVMKAERKSRSKGKLPSTKHRSKTDKSRIKKTTKVDQTTDAGTSARAHVRFDIPVDADSVPPRKPSKVYTPPFSRKSWRDVEPQIEPQVMYDATSGYNFLQVEDVQVFSFSTSSHDTVLRTAPVAPAAVEEGEGIGVWSPPVVGIFSWMWDYLGGAPKVAPVH
ncbi:hypothetical protein M431DRAFT_6012 [Trichoderma harzianum CBS 226.95]|uniref:Uncharacterized protein n=1 Tax=Trichoderma harzianum CBS 226.95 TaxID=983964 RepID=A0A2T4A9J3_TRIHA|nr:hypothetical protein M431DRAFT_6012 [Trichoderma harzianum CBS 226.95]PTB53716.1 hypothetical protein M431DRAFT_6012 [Trichoderma harzianum CBS 226.95]